MQGRVDLSNMTQDQFESMTNDNGDLVETYQESEEEEIEESDDSEQEEETEEDQEESEEEPDSGDDSEEVDWEAIDPRYKKAFEEARSEAQKRHEEYRKIQSHMTKQSQQSKEFEQHRQRLEERDNQLRQIEALLEQHPHLVDLIDRELAKATDPLESAEVPDYLKEDPAFKYIQQAYKPYVKGLEQKISTFEKKFSKFDEFERSQQESKNRQYLETQLDAAKEAVKSMFGRDATEDDVTKVLEYMVENKFYNNGKAAALAVFQDQYEKAISEKQQNRMKEKAGKFPSRNKSISASRVKAESDMDADDAIRASIADWRGN